MPRYAQINEAGLCIAVSDLSGEVEAPHMIPIGDGDFLGKSWIDGEWVAPVPSAPAPPSARITRLAFRNRFTQAEKIALELAALDNPSATMAQRQQAAALRAHLKDLDSATFVDLNHPEAVTAVQSLEAGGLLASGRAATILDVESITETERPLQ